MAYKPLRPSGLLTLPNSGMFGRADRRKLGPQHVGESNLVDCRDRTGCSVMGRPIVMPPALVPSPASRAGEVYLLSIRYSPQAIRSRHVFGLVSFIPSPRGIHPRHARGLRRTPCRLQAMPAISGRKRGRARYQMRHRPAAAPDLSPRVPARACGVDFTSPVKIHRFAAPPQRRMPGSAGCARTTGCRLTAGVGRNQRGRRKRIPGR